MAYWITRRIYTFDVSLWKSVGGSSEWTPGYELVGRTVVQAPSMNEREAREALRDAGFDVRGHKVSWRSIASDVYGRTVDDFMSGAVRVERTVGGHVTPVEE